MRRIRSGCCARAASGPTSSPSVRAVAITSAISSTAPGPPALAMIANRARPGTISRNNSSRLLTVSVCWTDRPVTLPPGRDRLATRPVPTGSVCKANTMGMTVVACFAAMTGPPDHVIMTSTLSRTKSAAISAKRSVRPSAQRYSIATFRFSIQPSSRSRCTKAATHWLAADGVAAPKKPMVGSFVCCARATSGQPVAALPRTPRKSRRLMLHPQTRDRNGSNEPFDRAETSFAAAT
jgi:hypothetical protein